MVIYILACDGNFWYCYMLSCTGKSVCSKISQRSKGVGRIRTVWFCPSWELRQGAIQAQTQPSLKWILKRMAWWIWVQFLMEGSEHLWLHMAGIWRKKFDGVRRYKRISVTATKTQIPLKPNYGNKLQVLPLGGAPRGSQSLPPGWTCVKLGWAATCYCDMPFGISEHHWVTAYLAAPM